ncbi:hypothetical protein OV203_37015 [Nannocystis sp. ILAH1]|uniref:hypothetical protein n=1 Tax=unclassified Nannocystis TaxID=2627009 RepID=UPI00226EDAEF|nr:MULTISPECIES: hypothetical protein [unclassified Nannocystis]MCY0992801.1 hypothetical protein [Nannocystis sp. ILAH1]MCY1069968.1 hypothetical protein [Nannocystis sp. RBIL2]
MNTPSAALEARLIALEATVRRLRLSTLGLVVLLLALVTCGSGGEYSHSSTQEQLGLLMAREIRVGDERAAVHIVGHELRMQREGVGTVTVESDRIRFLAVDGSERATFVVGSAPQWVVQQPAGPAKASP